MRDREMICGDKQKVFFQSRDSLAEMRADHDSWIQLHVEVLMLLACFSIVAFSVTTAVASKQLK